MWEKFKDKLVQWFGGLLFELKEQPNGSWAWTVALGRVAFWLVFVHCLYLWTSLKDVTASEMGAFYALLTYAGVKVAKDGVTEFLEAKKPTSLPG